MTVSGVPSVQWRRPSGGSATGNVVSGGVSGGRSLYISQLILNPLTLFDGGDYTCTATYSLGGHTSPSGMDTHTISIMSKCAIIDKSNNDFIQSLYLLMYIIMFYSTRAISDFASERYNRCRNLSWKRHNSYM